MPQSRPDQERELIPRAEALIAATGANFQIGGEIACYIPKLDVIRVPPQTAFHDQINYYRTVFHELGHWTGHASRLARDLSTKFASNGYAREELVAEMATAFVCASLGIVPTVSHADYIGNWLQVLKEDARAIFKAASMASKACDFILAFEQKMMKRRSPHEGDLPIPFETEPTPIGEQTLIPGVRPVSIHERLKVLAAHRLVPRNRRSPAISASSMKWPGTNWTCSAPIPQPERTNIMELMHIPLSELSIAKTNVRHGVKKSDSSHLIPSISKRGILQPLLVRKNGEGYEIVAGRGASWRHKHWRGRR